MKIRLSAKKPYESVWGTATVSALAFLLAVGSGVLAAFQPGQIWTFLILAILAALIGFYSIVSAAVNKGLFDCVILTESEAICKRAFRKARRIPYDCLEIRLGKVDGQPSYLFFEKGTRPEEAEWQDAKYPVIKESGQFFAAYSELGEVFFEKYEIPVIKEN